MARFRLLKKVEKQFACGAAASRWWSKCSPVINYYRYREMKIVWFIRLINHATRACDAIQK